jgi:hypothetical protein
MNGPGTENSPVGGLDTPNDVFALGYNPYTELRDQIKVED